MGGGSTPPARQCSRMYFRPTGAISVSNGDGSGSGTCKLKTISIFVATPFQNTYISRCPALEHNTAQSIWPGLANSPLITFARLLDSECWGMVHPRLSSAATTLTGSYENTAGDNLTIFSPALPSRSSATQQIKQRASVAVVI